MKISLKECSRQSELILSKQTREYERLMIFENLKYVFSRNSPRNGLEYIFNTNILGRDNRRLSLQLKQTFAYVHYRDNMDFNSFYLKSQPSNNLQVGGFADLNYLLHSSLLNQEIYKNLNFSLIDDYRSITTKENSLSLSSYKIDFMSQ